MSPSPVTTSSPLFAGSSVVVGTRNSDTGGIRRNNRIAGRRAKGDSVRLLKVKRIKSFRWPPSLPNLPLAATGHEHTFAVNQCSRAAARSTLDKCLNMIPTHTHTHTQKGTGQKTGCGLHIKLCLADRTGRSCAQIGRSNPAH